MAQVVSLSQHGECAATGTGAKSQASTQGSTEGVSAKYPLKRYATLYSQGFLIDIVFFGFFVVNSGLGHDFHFSSFDLTTFHFYPLPAYVTML